LILLVDTVALLTCRIFADQTPIHAVLAHRLDESDLILALRGNEGLVSAAAA
jgi:hypothetical protein